MNVNLHIAAATILLMSGCTASKTSGRLNDGRYATDNGSSILIFDKNFSYLGTSNLPASFSINNYGKKIDRLNFTDGKCVIMSGLTFAYNNNVSYECNGIKFRVIEKKLDSNVVIRAECDLFISGKCLPKDTDHPALIYGYLYDPAVGIKEIYPEFDQRSVSRFTLRHVSGSYLLSSES